MRTFCTILFTTFFSLVSQGLGQTDGASGNIESTDTVSISVHREEDLNVSGSLSKNGSITVPLIGSVTLAGRSTTSAEALIESKLLDGYLVRPEVTVRITKRQVRTVSVDGQVSQPGVFTLPRGNALTLRQVLSMAGGVNDVGNIKKIKITSGGKVRIVNLKDIISGKKPDVILQKSDFIWVPEGLF